MKKYETTAELTSLEGILGQKEATKAMEFGLKIEDPAYNIYLAGESGTGKTTYALGVLKQHAEDKQDHKDWCYVYNFESPRDPIALSFEKGMGKVFTKDMEKLIETLLDELRAAFESEEFEIGKNQIIDEYEIEKEALIQQIKKYGEEKGFKLKNSKIGMVFTPIDEDIDTTSEEFYKVKRELENISIQLVYKVKDLEDEAKEAILDLEEQIGMYIVDPHIEVIMNKYGEDSKVKEYIKYLRDDVLEYIYLFYMDEEDLKDKYDKNHFTRYKVNLFVDNGADRSSSSAPVIVEVNPSPSNLFGKVEYDTYNGSLKTDFTKIIPGAVHKANGGYLVLYADQILRYPISWDMLKRTIQSKKITIDTLTGVKPEAIPIDMKVILIGNSYLYNSLYKYDSEFNKYFKILVDFESDMNKNDDNKLGVARFVASYCNKNNLKHFTYDAVESLLKYSSRILGDNNKLSTKFNKIVEIIVEANAFASIRKGEFVDKEDVKEAIYERWNRLNKWEKRIDESFKKGFILLSTQGERVGVINGLSVLNMGEYSFGRPSVISVTTSPGSSGIINIEREVDMSGPIHSKGVLILEGYISENFSQKCPISLTSHICFEQNYGGVDGDSASGAELYALLSSLSGVPIKQNIAATGSINQKGDIQVVGGVTEKIEGFYSICKRNGLTGDQGVILPKNNLQNLVLIDEVQEAIDSGRFHIYPIDRIEEAVEILTGKPFSEIKELVIAKLVKYHEMTKG
jgi:lon-related putative ATP-dependent protease